MKCNMHSEVIFLGVVEGLSIPANPCSGQVGLKCVSINSYMLKQRPSPTMSIKNPTRNN
jgi:hypothetical protein